ncbi:hypothetical protein [Vreelandella azerica]|uniref:hypothetical protein n=1 Tax=Vreelandella azerica TaxID=2732867 RepID=UPI001490CF23|nr:hypothetical protein [Halomonas azerica]
MGDFYRQQAQTSYALGDKPLYLPAQQVHYVQIENRMRITFSFNTPLHFAGVIFNTMAESHDGNSESSRNRRADKCLGAA